MVSKKEKDVGELFEQILPEDLLKFGLIPEFVGRLPVIATLKTLDEQALIDILTKPKNALIKQYARLLELDNVKLEFEDDAILEVAKMAIERQTGARGLRAIIESAMTDIMYELPSEDDVDRCIVTKETIRSAVRPRLIYGQGQKQLTDGEEIA